MLILSQSLASSRAGMFLYCSLKTSFSRCRRLNQPWNETRLLLSTLVYTLIEIIRGAVLNNTKPVSVFMGLMK
jgi:hypothetical protein